MRWGTLAPAPPTRPVSLAGAAFLGPPAPPMEQSQPRVRRPTSLPRAPSEDPHPTSAGPSLRAGRAGQRHVRGAGKPGGGGGEADGHKPHAHSRPAPGARGCRVRTIPPRPAPPQSSPQACPLPPRARAPARTASRPFGTRRPSRTLRGPPHVRAYRCSGGASGPPNTPRPALPGRKAGAGRVQGPDVRTRSPLPRVRPCQAPGPKNRASGRGHRVGSRVESAPRPRSGTSRAPNKSQRGLGAGGEAGRRGGSSPERPWAPGRGASCRQLPCIPRPPRLQAPWGLEGPPPPRRAIPGGRWAGARQSSSGPSFSGVGGRGMAPPHSDPPGPKVGGFSGSGSVSESELGQPRIGFRFGVGEGGRPALSQ